MKNQGLVSVIIPVYNVEEYLRECIDSVLKQDYPLFEIILVDDGSTDASGKICDEYHVLDERIRVIHQTNQGLSGARNTGFSYAEGEYVYFLDSDDWIVPETLSELVNKAKQEKAEVVFFDANSFADQSEPFQVEQRYLRKYDYETDEGYSVLDKLQTQKEYHSAVPLLFLERTFLEENGIQFEPDILYEDMLYTYEVFCKSKKVSHIRKPFYQRRYRSNSIMTSRKNRKHFLSAKAVYEKVRNVSEQIEKLDDEVARRYVVRCAFNALNMYRKLSSIERREGKVDYKELKAMILEDKAYGDKALYMRCYGMFPWFCYKVYEKTLGRFLKGSN